MKTLALMIAMTVASLLYAYLQRRFSSETLVNGFMDKEKAEELAPTIFKNKSKKKK
ncbi:hypothetical protein [Simkania sp.]|uniref:hypothetical protein n=1 Tax=Simkania sp. TaxID=34094 RepID=UPI003B51ADCB